MLPMQFNEKQASHFERLVFIICFVKAKVIISALPLQYDDWHIRLPHVHLHM